MSRKRLPATTAQPGRGRRGTGTGPSPPRAAPTRHCTLAVGVLLLLSGCGGEGSPSGSAQVRDSAGVRIVQYRAMPSAPERWTVSPKPELVIGSAMGEGAGVFTYVQAVVRRPDGVLVVADQGTAEIRAFDPTGRHLWTTGERGSGPGEFRSLDALCAMTGDSILAFDHALGRVSVFDSAGEFGRTYRLKAPGADERLDRVLGVTGRGAVLASGLIYSGAMPKNGTYRFPGSVAWYDALGTRLSATDTTFGSGFAVHTLANGSYTSAQSPFNRRTVAAARHSEVDVANQIRFEIRRYDEQGRLDQILRVEAPPTLRNDAVRQRLVPGKEGAWWIPDTLPALGHVRLDPGGHLWIEDFLSRFWKGEARWWVFDGRSRLVADATVPKGFTVEQIDSDRVVGVMRDSLGVNYVQVRAIARGGG